MYNVLIANKVIPPTLCRGNGQCVKCKVRISQKNMSKPNKIEQIALARINLDAGFRLACQTVIKDDMVVDTAEITAPLSDLIIKITKGESVSNELKPVKNESPSEAEVFSSVDETSPSLLKNPQHKPAVHEISSDSGKNAKTDGILLVSNKQQLSYFVYSAAIDGISQDYAIENAEPLTPYIKNGMLSDYVYDILKIKDIDRMIILSDEPSSEGESLFDIASYVSFDIGATPCELIRPLPEVGDLSLFYRLLSIKGKKRLMISLDKMNYIHYFSEDNVIRLPNSGFVLRNNLLDLTPIGSNPIVAVSDDLCSMTTLKNFGIPDSLPLAILMKVTARMVEKKIVDSEFRIYSRSSLDSSVPLEYVVKITQYKGNNAFYLHRDKESSLIITQDMLSNLAVAKKLIHHAIEYTESNLGNIEAIVINTPVRLNGLMENLTALSLIPKRHEGILLYNPGDHPAFAEKLFRASNVRSYIQQNYGGFIKS